MCVILYASPPPRLPFFVFLYAIHFRSRASISSHQIILLKVFLSLSLSLFVSLGFHIALITTLFISTFLRFSLYTHFDPLFRITTPKQSSAVCERGRRKQKLRRIKWHDEHAADMCYGRSELNRTNDAHTHKEKIKTDAFRV